MQRKITSVGSSDNRYLNHAGPAMSTVMPVIRIDGKGGRVQRILTDQFTNFMTNEQANEIIKAQARLLMHLTERVVMLQVAFEAYVQGQIRESGAQYDAQYDAHHRRRKELFARDFQGVTTELLNTLSQAVKQADTGPSAKASVAEL